MKANNDQAMQIAVVSLFPSIFEALNFGVIGRALRNNLLELSIWNPRDESVDKHKTVDDRPYGGGPGMVMAVEPVRRAIAKAKGHLGSNARCIYLSPQGKTVTQDMLKERASSKAPLIFVAGRYEGIDERIIELDIDEEWSLSDIVLSGGEFAALAMIDGIVRLTPGALGCDESSTEESFSNGLLEYPQYTRPAEIDGKKVPDVLLNGNHQAIKTWRHKQALGRTMLKRPDLLAKRKLCDKEEILLNEFKSEYKRN